MRTSGIPQGLPWSILKRFVSSAGLTQSIFFSIILLSRPLLKKKILLPHCTINLILNTNSNRIFISPLIFIFKTGSDQWLNSCNFVQGPAQTPVRHLVKDILKVQFSLWNRSLPGAVSQSRWRPGPFLVPFVNPLKEFVLLSCLKICMQLKFKAHNCILQSQFASVLICSLNACEIKI